MRYDNYHFTWLRANVYTCIPYSTAHVYPLFPSGIFFFLIFSVSHLADGSLELSLLIDSKTVSTTSATLSVLFS